MAGRGGDEYTPRDSGNAGGRGMSAYNPPRATAPYNPPRAYQPYYPPPVYTPPAAPATPSFGIGTPTGGGMNDAPAPAPQPKPVISQADWLSGDSAYQDILGQSDANLNDFIARLNREKTDYTKDYSTAVQGLDKNKEQGLQNLGEDFTSRGLANSGLFADASQKANAGFEDQRKSLNTSRDRALADFSSQESEKRRATQVQKNDARRNSLARLAQKQAFS